MKKILTITVLSFAAFCLKGQEREIFIPGYDKEPDDEPVELFLPYERVHAGREMPRTFTVSYPDEESAARGSLAPSLYIQPMEGQPQITDGGAHIDYTWTYKMPFAWVGRLVILYIESADNPYWVIVNDREAGSNQSSRSAAEFDITALSREGLNSLVVRVEKDPAAGTLTAARGSGRITGRVLVHSQPRIRVRDYVALANFAGEEPTLELGVILKTHMLNARLVRIHYSLRDADGQTVASGHREAEVGLKEEDTVRFFTPAKALLPWTYESPRMYDLVIKNQYEGRYTEYVRYKVGFSNVSGRDGNLYIDGYRLPLTFHQSGDGGDTNALAEMLAGIKSRGANVVIAGNYPQGARFHELCDSLGLYVCVQADVNTSSAGQSRQKEGNPANDPRWAESIVDRAVTMHGTTASRPSSLFFSIARNSSNGYGLYESYLALKPGEPTRPVIYPEAGGEWNSDAVEAGFAREHPGSVGSRLILDPGRREAAYPDSDYAVIEVDGAGNCTVFNNTLVTPLRGTITYTVKKGMKKVAEGDMDVRVEPGGRSTVRIPVPESITGKKLKFETTLHTNFD